MISLLSILTSYDYYLYHGLVTFVLVLARTWSSNSPCQAAPNVLLPQTCRFCASGARREIHNVSRNRDPTQVSLQAQKLHVYGSGTFGAFGHWTSGNQGCCSEGAQKCTSNGI